MKYSAVKLYVVILSLATIIIGCSDDADSNSRTQLGNCPEKSCVSISGKLSERHVEAVHQMGHRLTSIVVSSNGGKSGYAHKIGKAVLEQKVDLIIVSECSSACFEFLVPAARSVTAINAPTVAVHGSPIMTELLLAREGMSIPGHCHWPSLDFQKRLYRQKNLKREFIYKTLEALGDIQIEFSVNDEGCLTSWSMVSEVKYWQPSSKEIETLLGVKIQGDLCKDVYDDCL